MAILNSTLFGKNLIKLKVLFLALILLSVLTGIQQKSYKTNANQEQSYVVDIDFRVAEIIRVQEKKKQAYKEFEDKVKARIEKERQQYIYWNTDSRTVIQSVFRKYGQGVVNTMLAIAQKESSMNPGAKGYAGEFYGLFQIYTGTWSNYGCTGNIFNSWDNTRCAEKIYLARGFVDWEVYTRGLI